MARQDAKNAKERPGDETGKLLAKHPCGLLGSRTNMSVVPTDSGAVAVRRPTARDWPRMREILETVNYHRIGGAEMPDFPLELCFVAELDGRIAGLAGYRLLNRTKAKTTLMAVDPACRGRGIGLLLQQARMDFLRARGLRFLYTNCDEEGVIDWYARHFGYQRTGRRVPKVEPFGLPDRHEWITLVCTLHPESAHD